MKQIRYFCDMCGVEIGINDRRLKYDLRVTQENATLFALHLCVDCVNDIKAKIENRKES